jgi:hypothetical protein
MNRTHNLKVPSGTYTVEGTEKTRWLTIGGLIKDGDKVKIKLDAIPVSAEWDGWIQAFEVEDKPQANGGGYPSKPSHRPNQNKPLVPDYEPRPGDLNDSLDDVPF